MKRIKSRKRPKLPSIIIAPDERLKHISSPVMNGEIDCGTLIQTMSRVLSKSGSGVGLAAPQIGVFKRVILVRYNQVFLPMINPEIVEWSKDEYWDEEGCLSYPGREVRIPRAKSIQVSYQDLLGNTYIARTFGDGKPYHVMISRIIQHEVDHLFGICRLDPSCITVAPPNPF